MFPYIYRGRVEQGSPPTKLVSEQRSAHTHIHMRTHTYVFIKTQEKRTTTCLPISFGLSTRD